MPGLRAITIVIAVCVARHAAADCVAQRALLARDQARAEKWNLGWGLGFTAATVIQAAGALTPVSDRQHDALVVGAIKSGVGALTHAILPLRVATPQRCEDVERLVRTAGKHERNLFFLNHLGGLALNLGGALVLGELHTWKDGLVSFAIGWPVGLFHAYTLPRGAWHEMRTISVVPQPGGALAIIGGEF